MYRDREIYDINIVVGGGIEIFSPDGPVIAEDSEIMNNNNND